MKLAIVMPAYNEERHLSVVVDRIRLALKDFSFPYRIIVVDDCSRDKTALVAKHKHVDLVRHRKNQGYGGALISGFKAASDADIIVTIDADGQHDPREIPSLIQQIVSGRADVVIGSRFLHKKTKFPAYRKFGIFMFTVLTNLMFDLKVSDCQSGLRAYRSDVLKNIELRNKGMGISLEILIRVAQKKYRIIEIPSVCNYYKAECSTNPVTHGLQLLKTLLMYYFKR